MVRGNIHKIYFSCLFLFTVLSTFKFLHCWELESLTLLYLLWYILWTLHGNSSLEFEVELWSCKVDNLMLWIMDLCLTNSLVYDWWLMNDVIWYYGLFHVFMLSIANSTFYKHLLAYMHKNIYYIKNASKPEAFENSTSHSRSRSQVTLHSTLHAILIYSPIYGIYMSRLCIFCL